jgi:hypothetical protein
VVILAKALGFGAGVVEAVGEKICSTTGTREVGQRAFCGGYSSVDSRGLASPDHAAVEWTLPAANLTILGLTSLTKSSQASLTSSR